MAKRNYWTEEEWVISLGYYIFNREEALKAANIQQFTERLNSITGNDRSIASIELRICNWRSLDPEFTGKGMSNGGKKLQEIWRKYIIEDDSLFHLAQKYSAFINNCIEQEKSISNGNEKEAYARSKVVSSVVYERSTKIKELTLKRAQGVCELCLKPAPFIGLDDKPYLEVHHVLPLAQGGLDVLSNTIALCPNCHRKAHYGQLSSGEKNKMKNT